MKNLVEYFTILAVFMLCVVILIFAIYFVVNIINILVHIFGKRKIRKLTRLDIGRFDVISLDNSNKTCLIKVTKFKYIKYFKLIDVIDVNMLYVIKSHDNFEFFIEKSSRGFFQVTILKYEIGQGRYTNPVEIYRV